MSLFRVVQQAGLRAPRAAALLAPQQSVALSYGELASRSIGLADTLRSKFGVSPGDLVLTNLPNVSEGLVLQLALQALSATLVTAKNEPGLQELLDTQTSSRLKLAVLTDTGTPTGARQWMAELPGVAVMPAAEVLAGPSPPIEGLGDGGAAVADSLPIGYFNSTKPLTDGEAVALGEKLAEKLEIGASDRIAVAITLYHQFSHMALHASFSRGGCVVLPAVGGIHGCGVPAQRAATTLEVLAGEKCSLLVADTHTLTALNAEASAAQLRDADLSALRGGVCKVGSGSDFLDGVISIKNVPLVTLGKRG